VDIKLVLINTKGLRFKLIMMFLVSLIISIPSGFLVDELLGTNSSDYYVQTASFAKQCKAIQKKIANAKNDTEIYSIINENVRYADIFILSKNGEVLIKNKNSMEKNFDLDSITNTNNNIDTTEYAIKYNVIDKLDNNRYILFSGTLLKSEGHSILVLIVPIIIFMMLFFILTNKELDYIKKLCLGLKEIAKGNLKYRVKIMGKDEISEIGKSINDMSQKLYEYKKKEKEIERDKDLFIMNISHDLRTPLTSIIGYVNLLKNEYNYNDNIRKYINIIDLKSTSLDKLINDFFEYNKLSNCEPELNKVNISLNEFIRQVVTGVVPLCSEKNLEIKLLLPNKDININIDPDKMLRVIENLLINSIRYCNIGSEIQVSLTEEENIIICITNECDDFNKAEINNIFNKFYRGDKARNSIKGGTGLGLAIAKNIVELHNGKILAEYNGKKICFKLIL